MAQSGKWQSCLGHVAHALDFTILSGYVSSSCTLMACPTALMSILESCLTRFCRRSLLTVVSWSAIALCRFPPTVTAASLG